MEAMKRNQQGKRNKRPRFATGVLISFILPIVISLQQKSSADIQKHWAPKTPRLLRMSLTPAPAAAAAAAATAAAAAAAASASPSQQTPGA